VVLSRQALAVCDRDEGDEEHRVAAEMAYQRDSWAAEAPALNTSA